MKLACFAICGAFTMLGLAVIGGGGLWGGYALNTALQNRFSLPSQVHYKLNGYYNSFFHSESAEEKTLITNRLLLTQNTVFLPLDAADFAGGIAALEDRSLLVTDRLGHLFHVADSTVTALNVQAPPNNTDRLQQQLDAGDLGPIEIDFGWFRYNDILAVPGADGVHLLLSYSEWHPEERCFGSTLARLDLPGGDPATWQAAPGDWTVVMRTKPCLPTFPSGKGIYGLEAGGRLALLSGSEVIWTSGSYEWDDRLEGTDFAGALAQDDATDYGKAMAVDFLTGKMRVLSKGLRNPQGLSVDGQGRIWVSDHGMRGGDELNLVRQGANFGFPAVSYGTKYNRTPAGNGPRHANHDGYDKPVAAFVPSIAPAAALAVQGFHPAWDGDILIGALSGALHRVHVEDGRAAYVEPIEMGVRIRDLARLGGSIVVYTDDRRVIYLTPDLSSDPILTYQKQLAALAPDPQLRAAVDSTFTACQQCHGLLPGEEGAGPTLHAVCGRDPGATAFDSYSGALSAIDGAWNKDSIAAFIADPATIAPDTTMAWGGIENREVASAIAGILCTL